MTILKEKYDTKIVHFARGNGTRKTKHYVLTIKCDHCSEIWEESLSKYAYENRLKKRQFCSRKCVNEAQLGGKLKNPNRKPYMISINEIKQRIYDKHQDTVMLCEETYVNTDKNCWFEDKKYGKWFTSLGSVLQGSGHPKRFHDSMRLSLEEIKKRIFEKHGSTVTIVDNVTTNIGTKATFLDVEFGEWSAQIGNVLNGHGHPQRGLQQRKQTWLKKYGVDNPWKSDIVQEKAYKNKKKVTRILHWKTNEELVCVGSYEVAFVNWCNYYKIDFNWQITHQMPDGRKYRIDAYIFDGKFSDTWIEIKGRFEDDDAKQKWVWFNNAHANSQLWDHKRLVELGIMLKKGPNPLYFSKGE